MADGILEDIIGDSSYGDPDAEPHLVRIPFAVPGIVKDRNDPLGLGRITLLVEGLFEDGTDWLTPCTNSGGIEKRGVFNPPRRNAVALAFFPMGIIGPGYYLAGGWAQKNQVPEGAIVEDDYTRAVFEDDQWLISVDDRPTKGQIEIKHKQSNTYIKCEGDGAIDIHTTAGKLQSDATEAAVLGNALQTYLEGLVTKLNTHTHTGVTTGPGISGTVAPSFFSNPSGILSETWKVK